MMSNSAAMTPMRIGTRKTNSPVGSTYFVGPLHADHTVACPVVLRDLTAVLVVFRHEAPPVVHVVANAQLPDLAAQPSLRIPVEPGEDGVASADLDEPVPGFVDVLRRLSACRGNHDVQGGQPKSDPSHERRKTHGRPTVEVSDERRPVPPRH